jgi:hypothetical protein
MYLLDVGHNVFEKGIHNPLARRADREVAYCLPVSLPLFSRCNGGIFAAQYLFAWWGRGNNKHSSGQIRY